MICCCLFLSVVLVLASAGVCWVLPSADVLDWMALYLEPVARGGTHGTPRKPRTGHVHTGIRYVGESQSGPDQALLKVIVTDASCTPGLGGTPQEVPGGPKWPLSQKESVTFGRPGPGQAGPEPRVAAFWALGLGGTHGM